MPHWALRLDVAIFYLVNVRLASPQFDVIMPFLTDIDNWRLVIALGLLALLILGGKKGRICALLLIVTITLTDQTSSSLIKPLVERARPCSALPGVRLLVGCSGAFSFPSSHATNLFGAASLLSRFYPALWPIFFTIATMVAYSRTYAGVHYPSDVLGGALLGVLCAWLVTASTRPLVSRILRQG
ncbi:MAG: phosphatase PAP2 family protein [bacterium]|jgi:undecaprenyl-diphosphatase|nr:phosphatase PAP2 family protein [candidate division KSB1 bacterium]MDH7559489.1 phosphatase PAP2 family protein [bacterium]